MALRPVLCYPVQLLEILSQSSIKGMLLIEIWPNGLKDPPADGHKGMDYGPVGHEVRSTDCDDIGPQTD